MHEQLSSAYDWSAVTKLDGSDDDKRTAFRKMNADLCALRDRMREHPGRAEQAASRKPIAHCRDHRRGTADRSTSEPRCQSASAANGADGTCPILHRHRMTHFLRMAAEQQDEHRGPKE